MLRYVHKIYIALETDQEMKQKQVGSLAKKTMCKSVRDTVVERNIKWCFLYQASKFKERDTFVVR